MVALSVPNAASGSLENKDSFLPFFSRILAPNTWCRHGFSQSNSGPKRASPGHTFGAKRSLWIPRKKICSLISCTNLGPEHVAPTVFLHFSRASSLFPFVSLILAPNT